MPLADMQYTPSATRAPRSRRAALAAAVVLCCALAGLLRALGLPALEMDGNFLVHLLARADGGFPYYYHALYLPLGALGEKVVGVGHSIDALLWLSAASGAGALLVAGVAFEREFGVRPALVAAAAVAASPAFWFMSANVEVHATQTLGGALALAAGVCATRRSTATAAFLLFAAQLFATLVHNSNAMLALGPVLIAARSAAGRVEIPRAFRLAAASGVAAALGLVLDHFARGGIEIPMDNARLDRLVTAFAQPPSVSFYAHEFGYAWFPLLVFVGACAPRSRVAWRAALPFLAGAAPGWALFLASGITSEGGYFGSGALFVAAALLAASRAAERRPFGRVPRFLFAGVCAVGVGFGVADTHTAARLELARIGDERFDLARSVLPAEGMFVSIDPSMQYVTGRVKGLEELPLAMALSAVLRERVGQDAALDILEAEFERAARAGRPLAFNLAWRALAEQLPDVARFHELLLERCERHYRFEARDVRGFPFLVGSPR